MKKLYILTHEKEESRGFECPGCGMYHSVRVKVDNSKGHVWGYNWNDEKPTFTPSILVRWEGGEERKKHLCHSFITDGKIRFLNDCTHKLAGKTVPLFEIRK